MNDFNQPTLDDLIAFYRAKPKKERGATTIDSCNCLIGAFLNDGTYSDNPRYEVWPDQPYGGHIEDNYREEEIPMDSHLNELAFYFDRFDPDARERNVSAGACVRIIERFKRKEGLA